MTNNNLPVASAKSLPATTDATTAREFVTMIIDGQLFGIPVLQVQDVLGPQKITRVPLSPREVAGSLNLRGRIVTAIDVRTRLGIPSRDGDAKSMSVVVEHNGEFYSLIVDQVGEVMSLSASDFEQTPATLDEKWREISDGVYRLRETLLIVIDVKRLLRLEELTAA